MAVQEKVREIVRPDPKAESEVANLRLSWWSRSHSTGGREQLKSYQKQLEALRRRGSQVEVKEVTKEVIKYTTDPGDFGKSSKGSGRRLWTRPASIERCDLEIYQLKQEIQSLKEAKPQVQTKEGNQEILQLQEDPRPKRKWRL